MRGVCSDIFFCGGRFGLVGLGLLVMLGEGERVVEPK